ncbi:GumC family protein [Segetibacter koreensis]|uniref:GumC family protein n=1 Tax=Segetibacter koreensis TaxID=398037 RepID=UPI0003722FAC|nr:polysaccharide biosynthesis tyrosine autokinase [Segetibacter koreensis]
MNQEDKDLFAGSSNGHTIKELLSKYFANYPLFISSLIICVGAGILYTRYTPPKYLATTSVFIKGNESSGTMGGGNSSDLIESALNGKQQVNIDNEIQLISSGSLMERVVAKHQFNISYFKLGKLLVSDLYLDAPFRLVPQRIIDSTKSQSITIKSLNKSGGTYLYGPEKEEKMFTFKWGKPFALSNNTFILFANGSIRDGDGDYITTWRPVTATAEDLSDQLTVTALDSKTSIIQLSILTENLEQGKDILNAVANEFNLSDIEDRNKLSENTVRFIDERLNIISGELKGVEGNMESYQGSNQLIDIKSQSSQSFDNSNATSNAIKELNIQQGIAGMILNYFNDPANNDKLVPSSLGLNDATLATLIAQYNELQLKKEREAPLVALKSTVMQDLNTQLENLKVSILENLKNINRNLKLQEANLQQHNNQYKQFLSALPHNERVMQEIKRKQSITEGLYLYLLQKREEAAISSTSANVAHYKQIDPAKSFGSVEPNIRNIRMYTILLGLFLPFGWIYLADMLNDKVSNRNDITKRVEIPIIGDISHINKHKSRFVSSQRRDLLGEQLRTIRTNLSFLNKKTQVVLITSSATNEGKSFVSINLASVLAMSGKKVALLEFDLRKPGISMALNIDNNLGITDYLTGATNNLGKIYHISKEIPSLDIYPSGAVPLNPADVLLNENISALFAELRPKYDYIIIDSAPVGVVSDAFIFGYYSDVVLYIIRQRQTLKKQLDFVNDIYKSRKLNNIGLILNDVKTGGKYGYSGYGYESKNGYYNNERLNGKKVFTWAKRKNSINI